jgi:acyl carrier protein
VEALKLPGEAIVHDQIRNELREFIGDNYLFGDHDRLPDDEASLLEEGIVDSTGILELIEFLEDHFGIVVGESETVFENLGSVGGLTRFVASKTLAGQPVG